MYSRAGHVYQESAQAAYVRHYSVSRAQLQGVSARNVGLSRLLIAQTSGAPTNRKNPSSIDFPVWAFPDRRQLLWDTILAPGETMWRSRQVSSQKVALAGDEGRNTLALLFLRLAAMGGHPKGIAKH